MAQSQPTSNADFFTPLLAILRGLIPVASNVRNDPVGELIGLALIIAFFVIDYVLYVLFGGGASAGFLTAGAPVVVSMLHHWGKEDAPVASAAFETATRGPLRRSP